MYPVDMRYHEMMFTMTWPPVIESWFVDAMVYGIWVTTCYHTSMDCKFATIENVVSWWNQLKSIFLGAELHNNNSWYVFHDTLDRLALQVTVMHGWWLSNSDQDRLDMVQLHALCPHIWASTLYDIWEHMCILSSSISPTQLRKTLPTSPPEKNDMASDYLTLRKTTGPHATPRASSRQVEEPKAFSEFLASRRCGGFLGTVKLCERYVLVYLTVIFCLQMERNKT